LDLVIQALALELRHIVKNRVKYEITQRNVELGPIRRRLTNS